MKRHGNLYPQICSRENIASAFDSVVATIRRKRGSQQRAESLVRRLQLQREQIIGNLHARLKSETYRLSEPRDFTVREPKERHIQCPSLTDKFIHHALMNVVKPLFIEKFTADAFGSIEGKGREAAARRIQRAMRRHAWYLQTDVRHFYESIDHDVCKAEVRRIIKCKPTLRLIDAIIDKSPKGLAIGFYPSQYLANMMLSRLDHYMREVQHVSEHIRYMDDCFDFFDSKEEAFAAQKVYEEKLTALKLELKPNWRVAPTRHGMDALGWVFYPTHTRLRKRIKQNFKAHVRTAMEGARNIDDPRARVNQIKRRVASYWGMIRHCDGWHLWEKYMGEYKDIMTMKYRDTYSTGWFGVPEERRVRLQDLVEQRREIAITRIEDVSIHGESKAVIIFRYPGEDEDRCFITQSAVITDRVRKFFGQHPEETLECTVEEAWSERNRRKFLTIR